MPSVHYDNVTEARKHLKQLLDAAAQGFPAQVGRDGVRFAVVDVVRLRQIFSSPVPAPQVVAEADGWSVFIPGVPVAADGSTLDEALDEIVEALREYALDWADHLSAAPNHRRNWGLVQFVELSSDEELAEWARAGQRTTV
jgi:predicted RNase H-like HicB family nuclease